LKRKGGKVEKFWNIENNILSEEIELKGRVGQ